MAVIISFFGLIGCQSQPELTNYYFTPKIKTPLPDLSTAPNIIAQQLLTVESNYNKSTTNSALTLLNLSPQELNLVLLSPVGIKLAQIQFDGKQVAVQQFLPLGITSLPPPTQIVGDILLTALPLKTWENHLPQGWSLIEKKKQRLVVNQQNEIMIELNYMDNKKLKPEQIINNTFLYKIKIQNLQFDQG